LRTVHRIALGSTLAACLLACPAAAQARFDTIYNFADGVGPSSGLALAKGVLYGTTASSTPQSECGQVFQLNPPTAAGGPWTQTVLYSFPGLPGVADANGCDPIYAPVMGADGALYGITYYGGEYGYGVFYQLTPPVSPGSAWTESALYSFAISPPAPLVRGPNGSFYEPILPGSFGEGAILWIQPPACPGAQWTFTTLCSFPSGSTQGAAYSIVPAPGGLFYGTVETTSGNTGGEVIEISPPATPGGTCGETVLYAFGDSYVNTPNSLIRAGNGTLYGTTVVGSAFQLTPPASTGGAWTYTQLRTFGYYQPRAPLLLHHGNLYGTLDEYIGGQTPSGIIFELKPPTAPGAEWTLVYLHQFTNGQVPVGPLVMDPGGAIFGATSSTIYRIVP